MVRAHYTNSADMMAAIQSPDFIKTGILPRPPPPQLPPIPPNYPVEPQGSNVLFSPGEYLKGLAMPLFKLK